MESTCGHDPVKDNVFSSRISLNNPIDFYWCQFLPPCSSCYHPITTLVSDHRLSPVKAFPSPAPGICLRSSLPLRPWPCGVSSLPGMCEQGLFCLSLCSCVVVGGISQHLHSHTGLDMPASLLGSFKPIESGFLCFLTVPLWDLSPAFKILWMKAIYIFAFNNVFEVLKSS